MTALVTLWMTVEGIDESVPVTCGPKDEVLEAGRGADAAGVTLGESQWAPCCRDPQVQAACIRDAFMDYPTDAEIAIIREACTRAGSPLPDDIAGT